MKNNETFKFILPQTFYCDLCETFPQRVIEIQPDPNYVLQDKRHIYLCENHLKELKDFLNENV